MGYYIRVLTPRFDSVARSTLERNVQSFGATVTSENANESIWDQLVVRNSAGEDVCVVERNEVTPASMAEEEIGEFQDEIATCYPTSAANWLQSFLHSVHVIYAFQVLSGTYAEKGWEILGAVKAAVLNSVGGIIQADNEGFTNEEGYHILWQFSDDVSGDWWMAVLKDGEWQKFKMDLGDQAHRLAFKAGEVPTGAEHAG